MNEKENEHLASEAWKKRISESFGIFKQVTKTNGWKIYF